MDEIITSKQVFYCFDPIIDPDSRVLILGSLPGPESLKSGEYYKNSTNCFWKLIYKLYDSEPTDSYEEKCNFILANRLALWDVFRSAERENAADANIVNETLNDFAVFFHSNQQIKGIVFNGRTAEKAFRRMFPDIYISIPNVTVLSTSGACRRTFSDKLENWRTAINSL